MSQGMYSAEQVAEQLGLHVRTVRNYVREGRLKAVRIGKQYRIAREDLRGYQEQPLRIETAYDEVRGRLKLIILGDLTTTAEPLRWIALLAEGES